MRFYDHCLSGNVVDHDNNNKNNKQLINVLNINRNLLLINNNNTEQNTRQRKILINYNEKEKINTQRTCTTLYNRQNENKLKYFFILNIFIIINKFFFINLMKILREKYSLLILIINKKNISFNYLFIYKCRLHCKIIKLSTCLVNLFRKYNYNYNNNSNIDNDNNNNNNNNQLSEITINNVSKLYKLSVQNINKLFNGIFYKNYWNYVNLYMEFIFYGIDIRCDQRVYTERMDNNYFNQELQSHNHQQQHHHQHHNHHQHPHHQHHHHHHHELYHHIQRINDNHYGNGHCSTDYFNNKKAYTRENLYKHTITTKEPMVFADKNSCNICRIPNIHERNNENRKTVAKTITMIISYCCGYQCYHTSDSKKRNNNNNKMNKNLFNNLLTHQSLNIILFIILMCIPMITASVHNIKYSTNIVKTKYGPLRGIIVRSNPPVEAFLGVPYATPPLGSLRYMPPVTPSTWRNTRLADRFSPVCPQAPPTPPSGPEALLEMPRGRLAQLRRLLPLLANHSEDCLYLNLYVPRHGDTGGPQDSPMATIVYVHGESYEWNSGNPYDGSVLAAHGNVIVVTINFRLGIFGFLKTGAKGSAQGNFGLMDLVAGLHWLRENLPAFNGNPEKVTLMGHGTGAALANILVVSPVASDLVHRAILLSGSALSPWAIQKDPLSVKRRVAEQTGCHGDVLEEDLAPCLRTKKAEDLLLVKLDTPRFLPGFAPFIDGTVIVNPTNAATSPLTLPAGSAIASTSGIELADFPTRELLFGLTSIESYLDFSAQDLEFGFNETRRDRILRTYVRNVYHFHLNEIFSALKNEYTDWERPTRNPLGSRDAALELLGDGHTAAPLVRLGYLHSLRGGRSYFLHFRHQSSERDFPQRSGSVRGEDVPFCLGLPLSPLYPHNYTKQDIKISRILVRYLANFAFSGNPNPQSTSADISHNSYEHSHIVNNEENRKSLISNSANSDDQMLSVKQKRRVVNKRNTNSGEELSNADDEEEDDDDIGIDDDEETDENVSTQDENEKRDRLFDDVTSLHVPFWDTYDSINQLYLELGSKVEIRNHYRGHKLSMWLSLIPQLHSPGDSELPMRHHNFPEESAQFYDGIIRDQLQKRPPLPKIIVVATTTSTLPPKTEMTSVTALSSTTTDCPPNSTIVPTIAATRPHQNPPANSISNSNSNNNNNNNNNNNSNNLLRRLVNSEYQSYTTALTVTIAVGCFLLLLNVFIFAGIYYQREKRANDAKKKEELTENENRCSSSPSIDKCSKSSRKSSLQSVSGYPSASFGEYSCYDEKIQCKEKRSLADICSVELPLQEFKNSPSDSATSSLRRSINSDIYKHSLINTAQENLVLYPPNYNSPPIHKTESHGTSTNGLISCHQIHQPVEQCNQATQSDHPMLQDVGTTVTEKDVIDEDDELVSPGIPEPPPPPRSMAPYQGGILRHQQGGPTTPGTSKKRVQIQEISV